MKKKKKLFLDELKKPNKKTQAACLQIARPPMNWCYALVKTGDKDNTYYMVKEIYHVQGRIVSYCDSPIILGAEDPKDVIKLLKSIIRDIKGSPFVS